MCTWRVKCTRTANIIFLYETRKKLQEITSLDTFSLPSISAVPQLGNFKCLIPDRSTHFPTFDLETFSNKPPSTCREALGKILHIVRAQTTLPPRSAHPPTDYDNVLIPVRIAYRASAFQYWETRTKSRIL
jgi:hypothetical protein